MKAKLARTAFEYGVITVATLLLVVGVYFFKFPNNFSFGGVTGIAVVLSAMSKASASSYTFIINMALLVLGFLFLGKSFGAKTVYVSVLTSVGLSALEKLFPMSAPLTTEPVLELIFAIFLPALVQPFIHIGSIWRWHRYHCNDLKEIYKRANWHSTIFSGLRYCYIILLCI